MCWVVAIRVMNGMDMGTATELGSFGFFAAAWASMTAAMMLPGAVMATSNRARATGRMRVIPMFVGSYLAVWMLAGLVVYALYRPHGTTAAGALVIGAGIYELTPMKARLRQRCRGNVRSGLDFGICCVGSTGGLMVVLLAVGAMSITWMWIVALVALAQKVLPPRPAPDTLIALLIVGVGILIVASPTSIPGLTPAM